MTMTPENEQKCAGAERLDLSQLKQQQHPQQLEQHLAESLEAAASLCRAT